MMKRIICWILMMGMLGVVFASNVYAEENVAGSDELKTVRVGYLIYEGYQEGAGDAPKSGYGYEYLQQLAYYAGWKYEYVNGSFSELLEMLKLSLIHI